MTVAKQGALLSGSIASHSTYWYRGCAGAGWLSFPLLQDFTVSMRVTRHLAWSTLCCCSNFLQTVNLKNGWYRGRLVSTYRQQAVAVCGSGVLRRDMNCLFWRFAPERRKKKKEESCQPLQRPSRGTHSNLVSNASCICDLGCIVFNFPPFCVCVCCICWALLVIFVYLQ